MGKMKSEGVKKGAWTKEEDHLLRKCIDKFGEGKWHRVPLRSGLVTPTTSSIHALIN